MMGNRHPILGSLTSVIFSDSLFPSERKKLQPREDEASLVSPPATPVVSHPSSPITPFQPTLLDVNQFSPSLQRPRSSEPPDGYEVKMVPFFLSVVPFSCSLWVAFSPLFFSPFDLDVNVLSTSDAITDVFPPNLPFFLRTSRLANPSFYPSPVS